MVADAQAHSDEDRKRREEIEARNTADSTAYQVGGKCASLATACR
jgi:molecular chaperone DnaK